MNSKLVFIFAFILFGMASAQGISYIALNDFGECEGPLAGNYTAVTYSSTQDPSSVSALQVTPTGTIIQYGPNGKPIATNSFQVLAQSNLPAGANSIYEGLWLVTSGPLAGIWIFFKGVYLSTAYLKKSSSILGLSYIFSKNVKVLFTYKLNPNILISPTGAFDAFKKTACTVCSGSEIIV